MSETIGIICHQTNVSTYYKSQIARKSIFEICDQVILKPACSATEASKSIVISDKATICIIGYNYLGSEE